MNDNSEIALASQQAQQRKHLLIKIYDYLIDIRDEKESKRTSILKKMHEFLNNFKDINIHMIILNNTFKEIQRNLTRIENTKAFSQNINIISYVTVVIRSQIVESFSTFRHIKSITFFKNFESSLQKARKIRKIFIIVFNSVNKEKLKNMIIKIS